MDVMRGSNGSGHGVPPDRNAIAVAASDANAPARVLPEASRFAGLSAYYTDQVSVREALRVRACAGSRLSVELEPVLGTGRMDLHQFRNGLTLSVGDYTLWGDMEESYPSLGHQFGFSIMLDGRFDVTAPDFGIRQHVAHRQVWLRAGEFGATRRSAAAGTRMRGLSVNVPADMVEEWREDGPRAFNPAFGRILSTADLVYERVASVNGQILNIADALVDANTDTACGRLHAESLALDLLTRLLAPEAGPEQIAGAGARLGRHRQVALDEAMDILQAEWLDPPTISRLARRVGLNECYLKAGFRERFGATIAGTVRTLRMTEARRLLERDGYSVHQAAQAVGYAHAGYFAAVFRTEYGCLPSQIGVRRGNDEDGFITSI